MFALLKPSTLRLIALIIVVIPLLAFTKCPLTSSTGTASFKGCFDISSTIKLVSPGRYEFDSFGEGNFFVGLDPSGQMVTLDLLIDTNPNLNLLSGNAKVITTQGDRIFVQLDGNTVGPDANQVVTFSGKLKVFGGTGGMLGTKGSGNFNGSVNLNTGEGAICFDGYIFRTFFAIPDSCIPMGPSAQSMIVFGALLTGWVGLLLYRRRRRVQL